MTKDTQNKDNPVRQAIARFIAQTKRELDKTEEVLDAAGEERKELTPDMVDALRTGLQAIFPDADDAALQSVLELIVETISEAMPETDVPEEMMTEENGDKAGDKADEEEDKDKAAAMISFAEAEKQFKAMADGIAGMVADAAEVIGLVLEAQKQLTVKSNEANKLEQRIKTLETKINQRPRRASAADETLLNPESELGKSVETSLYEPPPNFKDMFNKNGGA